ncbi:amino acid ABC transporter substrate-binding protein [Aliikangiella marina]|uniref:Amino acid ABC transporter substrate-binding protein n=1 Tax=Aliikangiella marina TaxID=1712262 RepID=A0A545TJC3_9GAMM|nr:transporter substrate-binding domain-containing protein [Aliikangiella marina]TQV77318.1 amino acid ABC transporter substrate-binding protein [Aliikangiella marina]
MYKYVFIFSLVIAPAYSLAQETLQVRFIPPSTPGDPAHSYYIKVIDAVLSATETTDGPYQLKANDIYLVQSRAIAELSKNRKIDVYWTMTSKQRESLLRPIKIPLLKGYLGYRVFLIRAEDKEKFAKITTIEELSKLVAGRGHDWPDRKILEFNGLNVLPVSTYDALFTMLEKKRIDYFPRGINEAWQELEIHSEKNFVVDENILFRYPAPVYFFVHPDNERLAARIQRGLDIIINNGQFDDLLKLYPESQEVLQKANIENRRIFELKTP